MHPSYGCCMHAWWRSACYVFTCHFFVSGFLPATFLDDLSLLDTCSIPTQILSLSYSHPAPCTPPHPDPRVAPRGDTGGTLELRRWPPPVPLLPLAALRRVPAATGAMYDRHRCVQDGVFLGADQVLPFTCHLLLGIQNGWCVDK